jgi:hypothetical protein
MTVVIFAQVSAQTSVNAEKQAAIKELLTIMNSQVKVSDLLAMVDAQAERISETSLEAMIAEDKTITPNDKKLLEEIALKDAINMSRRYTEKAGQKINLEGVVNEITVAIYEKNFTLEEINDLVVFYKSATGQKLLKATPLMFADIMNLMTEKFVPKMMKATKETQDEMKKELEQNLKEQKTQTKKKDTK